MNRRGMRELDRDVPAPEWNAPLPSHPQRPRTAKSIAAMTFRTCGVGVTPVSS